MTTKHVYLGRFAPFHKGHYRLVAKIVEREGVGNSLILIGSSNALNTRTPYSYEDRKKIIEVSFPGIEILPLPDAKADLLYFDGSTNEIWLDSLVKLAKERNEKFVFYGGSKEDLEILAERFETHTIVDRYGEGENLSATKVRELLLAGNVQELKKIVDPNAINLIINSFKRL